MRKIIAILLLLATMLSLCACTSDYDEAMKLYKDGKYKKAYDLFSKLDDDKSEEMAIACQYKMAVEEKDYEEVAQLLAQLAEYSDEYWDDFYQTAVSFLEEKEYADALSCFRLLEDYAESDIKRKEAAMKLLQQFVEENGTETKDKKGLMYSTEPTSGSDFSDFTMSYYVVSSPEDTSVLFCYTQEMKLYLSGTIVDDEDALYVDYSYANDLIDLMQHDVSVFDQVNDFTTDTKIEATAHVSKFRSGEVPTVSSYLKEWSVSNMDDETEIPDGTDEDMREALVALVEGLDVLFEHYGVGITAEDLGF